MTDPLPLIVRNNTPPPDYSLEDPHPPHNKGSMGCRCEYGWKTMTATAVTFFLLGTMGLGAYYIAKKINSE